MSYIKKGNVYRVVSQCLIRPLRDFLNISYSWITLTKNEIITVCYIHSESGIVIIKKDNLDYILGTQELSILIKEGFLSLENKTMTTNTTVDNTDRSKIKYRIIHILQSLLIENEYQSINEQLATWKISPKTFNVSVYGDIDWKDPGNYEKAISLIADKIVGE